MNATKTRGYAKKLLALVMAIAIVCSMAICASADDADLSGSYSVTIYKENSTTTLSMANDIVNGNATVTVVDDVATIVIPIKPITNYTPMSMSFLSKADGYLWTLEVDGATSATVSPTGTTYSEAEITIVMPNFSSIYSSSGTEIDVTDSYIQLYKAGTTEDYSSILTHVTPAFTIVLK